MSRFKAASIHLAISVFIFSLFLALVFFVWYAFPFNHAQGIGRIVYIMAGVDVILGPLLTLILFKSGKKGMVFDLIVVAAVQIAALGYGSYVIYSERPVYAVLGHNIAEVVVRSEINQGEVPENIAKIGVFDRPQFVFQERSKQPELDEFVYIMQSKKGDPERLAANAKSYLEYSRNADQILLNTKKIESSDDDDIETKAKLKGYNYHYAIMRGKLKEILILIDPQDASVSGYLLKSKLLTF